MVTPREPDEVHPDLTLAEAMIAIAALEGRVHELVVERGQLLGSLRDLRVRADVAELKLDLGRMGISTDE